MSTYAKLRLSILFLFVLMLGMIWDNYHRYQEFKTQIYTELNSRLYNSAMTSAKLLGDDFHNNLTDLHSLSLSQDKQNEALLNTIADNSKIEYVYSLIDVQGKIRFSSSSNKKEDYEKGIVTRYFDPYPELQNKIRDVLKTDSVAYHEYSDRWGTFRSIFIPLKSSNGTPYVMGADIDISDVNSRLDHVLIDFIIIPFGIFSLVISIGIFYIYLSEKMTKEFKESNKELEKLRQDLAQKTFDLEVKNHQLQKMNITLETRVDQEIEKNIEKDHQLIHQSRLAQLGEMVSMIAHQWRQPLAAIGANVLDIKLKFSLEKFDFSTPESQAQCIQYIDTTLEEIEENVQMLTSTIDDFRNFYKADKSVRTMSIQNPIEQAIKVMKGSFDAHNILLTQDYRATRMIELYDSEMTQVFLNILKNALDNFIDRRVENPIVMISTYHTVNNGIGITICDNGGGIDDSIVDKIFDPYFSTKNELNGTGLGLYMSKTIVEEHHKGSLTVSKIPRGVCFKIELEGIRS